MLTPHLKRAGKREKEIKLIKSRACKQFNKFSFFCVIEILNLIKRNEKHKQPKFMDSAIV